LPDQFAAQAYAAAQVVAALVKSGASTKDEFLAALQKVRIVQTVLGPIAFDQNRDVKAAAVVLQITKDGFAYFK
jgi:ABC-type branched-subunit amino acid transport system substrate-binding protein